MIRKLFWELEEEERLIIGMHLFCGYKTREIAELLHMNENTVRSKESRALKRLADQMTPERAKRRIFGNLSGVRSQGPVEKAKETVKVRRSLGDTSEKREVRS